jgi:hypothetical protein
VSEIQRGDVMTESQGLDDQFDYSGLREWVDGDVPFITEQRRDDASTQFECKRCRAKWSTPSLTAEARRRLADLVRRERIFEWMAFLRSLGFTFAEAKPTSHHITSIPDRCHKCGRELPNSPEETVCRCRSLNLNW